MNLSLNYLKNSKRINKTYYEKIKHFYTSSPKIKNFSQIHKFKSQNSIQSFSHIGFINKNHFTLSNFINFKTINFCTLDKLEINKLTLDKISDSKTSDFIVEKQNEKKEFNKEDYIIEYTPQVKWEDEVLKSEIPVVVDCYAM
jgi:hypothetical protein